LLAGKRFLSYAKEHQSESDPVPVPPNCHVDCGLTGREPEMQSRWWSCLSAVGRQRHKTLLYAQERWHEVRLEKLEAFVGDLDNQPRENARFVFCSYSCRLHFVNPPLKE